MTEETPEINVGALSEALNDKADRNLANLVPGVLSTLVGGGGNALEVAEFSDTEAGWYILFKNGLLIQLIKQHPAMAATSMSDTGITWNTVPLLTPYRDTSYFTFASSASTQGSVSYMAMGDVQSLSNTTLQAQALFAVPANTLHFFCIGLAEVPQD